VTQMIDHVNKVAPCIR